MYLHFACFICTCTLFATSVLYALRQVQDSNTRHFVRVSHICQAMVYGLLSFRFSCYLPCPCTAGKTKDHTRQYLVPNLESGSVDMFSIRACNRWWTLKRLKEDCLVCNSVLDYRQFSRHLH